MPIDKKELDKLTPTEKIKRLRQLEEKNKKEIERLSGIPVLTVIPHIPKEDRIRLRRTTLTALEPLLGLFHQDILSP